MLVYNAFIHHRAVNDRRRDVLFGSCENIEDYNRSFPIREQNTERPDCITVSIVAWHALLINRCRCCPLPGEPRPLSCSLLFSVSDWAHIPCGLSASRRSRRKAVIKTKLQQLTGRGGVAWFTMPQELPISTGALQFWGLEHWRYLELLLP